MTWPPSSGYISSTATVCPVCRRTVESEPEPLVVCLTHHMRALVPYNEAPPDDIIRIVNRMAEGRECCHVGQVIIDPAGRRIQAVAGSDCHPISTYPPL